jgi:predicted permease
VDLGFDPDNALVVSFDVSKSGYDRERGRLLQRELLERVRRLPGVRGAALSRHVPVQDPGMITSLELTSYTPPPDRPAHVPFAPVSPGFFETLGIRLEQGRDFGPSDETGPSVLIVNRAFADRFWPGRNPLAERVLNFGEKGAEVIGVAANARLASLRESNEPMIYVPDSSFYSPNTSLLVRTIASPGSVQPAVTGVLRDLDRQVPIASARSLRDHVALSLADERVSAALLSAFALLALLLAGIGLYGVIAYTTELRSKEFGIRLALGARRPALLALVLSEGLTLAVIGVSLGLLAAAAASRVLSSLLYGVAATDPATFALIGVLLLGAAVAASLIPARRASTIDAIRTLRSE